MVEFLLRDRFPEPNSEEYDYLVKLDINGESKKDILIEIDNFIKSIEEYDDCVTSYLKAFLESKNIRFKIKRLYDIDCIYY